jgi:hypothetical protein
MTYLDASFYDITVAELDAAILKLEAPFSPPSSMRDLLALHRSVHAYHVSAGQPINEVTKVKYLAACLKKCGAYSEAMRTWMDSLPSIAGRTFEGLAAVVLVRDGNIDASATAGSEGYSNAASAIPPTLPVAASLLAPSDLERMISAAVSVSVAAAVKMHLPTSVRPAVAPPPVPQSHRYCFTHGSCGHDGQHCRHPGPGHQVQATLKNQMGGRFAAFPPK